MQTKSLLPLVLMSLVACSVGLKVPVKIGAAANLSAPSTAQIMNGTFSGVFEHPFTFSNGFYQGAPFTAQGASRPEVRLWEELIVFGDLDGRPGDEAALLMSATSGGTGEQIYVAAVGTKDDKLEELGTLLVGDRTKVRSLRIADRNIVMDVVESGPQEPACCPTQLAEKKYVVQDGHLQHASSTGTGRLSLAILAGTDWTLVELDGQPVAAALKAPTLSFRDGQVAGFSGCNRFFGGVKESSPGRIAVGPLAGTRMACPKEPMALEDRYLARLSAVAGYTFLAGKLALVTSQEAGSSSLKFARQAPGSQGAAPVR